MSFLTTTNRNYTDNDNSLHFPLREEDPLLPRASAAYDRDMQIQLSHPARTIEIKGPKKAKELLKELNLMAEAHLVIRDDELVTEDEMLYDQDQVEIRPVISGGSPRLIFHSSLVASQE